MSSRTPAIVGFLIAGALILGLGFFGNRSGESAEEAQVADLPMITLILPEDGDTVDNPVKLFFDTETPLELHPGMGWMAGDLHVHAIVNGTEVMPAAADIEVSMGGYYWRLPALAPGSYRVHLSWAARHHGNLPVTTDTLGFLVR